MVAAPDAGIADMMERHAGRLEPQPALRPADVPSASPLQPESR
jgi:hypothetical protein